MRKMMMVLAASLFGGAAFAQMGPFQPLPPAPNGRDGWAYAATINNGVATVKCYYLDNHKCVRIIMGLDGRPVAEAFDKDGKSLAKYSYSTGEIATAPDKSAVIVLKNAKQL